VDKFRSHVRSGEPVGGDCVTIESHSPFFQTSFRRQNVSLFCVQAPTHRYFKVHMEKPLFFDNAIYGVGVSSMRDGLCVVRGGFSLTIVGRSPAH
jgi:hypothetical protein